MSAIQGDPVPMHLTGYPDEDRKVPLHVTYSGVHHGPYVLATRDGEIVTAIRKTGMYAGLSQRRAIAVSVLSLLEMPHMHRDPEVVHAAMRLVQRALDRGAVAADLAGGSR